jgi:hypothetical protein
MSIEGHVVRGAWFVGVVLLAASCSSTQPAPPDTSDAFTYEYKTYLTGLEENARIVKTLRWVRVYLDDGRVVSEPEMQALDAAARRAKFGAMDAGFARYVRKQPAGAVLKVAFMFAIDPVGPPPAVRPGADGDKIRLQMLKDSIARGYRKVEPILRANGVKIERTVGTMPVVFGEAAAADIDRVSQSTLITLAVTAEPRKGVLHVSGLPGNGVMDPHIDTTFNANGHYAAGQKIGIVEMNHAGLFDTHEAFSQAEVDPNTGERVTYQVEPQQNCTQPSDCIAPGSDCIILHDPNNKQCVSAHASSVASVAAGTNGADCSSGTCVNGVPYGAAWARYYYPNGQPDPTNVCNPSDLALAYDWLANQGVTVVNESWGCDNNENYGGNASLDGITQDWYARHANMAIFKSAGNQDSGTGDCTDPSAPACPYTLNSTCVGANKWGGAGMAPYSNWTNRNAPPDGSWSDREEPDISMFGGGSTDPACQDASGGSVDILNAVNGFQNEWTTQHGTSLAAPAAAAMAALCQEVMYPLEFQSSQREQDVRAILKSSGFARNIADYRYSMAFTSMTSGTPDWRDGGGTPMAEAVWMICNGIPSQGDLNEQHGTDPGDLTGGQPFPFANGGGGCPSCNNPNSQLNQSSAGDVRLQSAVVPALGDGRRYHQIPGVFNVNPGQRIRAVIVWDSCPGAPTGTAPAPVATDIDLFLVEPFNNVVDASQSVSDVTEGFDVAPVDNGFAPGPYQVWWAATPGAGCDGSWHEPLSYAVWWGSW